MKIRATVTIEVDPKQWVESGACDRDEVRGDVIDYIRGTLQGAAMFSEDTDATVAVK